MLSHLVIALSSSLLFTTSLAAPLRLKSRATTCSPQPDPPISTEISPLVDRDYVWTMFADDAGTTQNVSIAFAHIEYETTNPYATRIDFGFTRVDGTNDQYRLEFPKGNGVSECLAAASSSQVLSAPCTSDTTSWTIECSTCEDESERCLIKSTKYQTCAIVDSDLLVALGDCPSIDDLPTEIGDPFSDVPIESLVGNQAWRVL
ncbi:hypothetical protein JCM5353_002880 [Sporobolomyces roseus]